MSIPRLSVNNPVVVHLLLAVTLILGVYCGFTLVREMFPESRPRMISITTPYPGATPSEVERGISKKIEEAIKDVEYISKITTSVNEGLSSIMVELTSDATDLDAKVNEFKNRVDAIPRDEFPEKAEETQVTKLEPRLPVISVTIFGEKDEQSLKLLGRKLRDEILVLPDITNVVVGGSRKAELTVEIEPEKLIEFGTSMTAVADAVRRTNLDLPGGQIKTRDQNIAVRTLGESDDAATIEDTIVSTTPEGRIVRVRDLGRVIDEFEDQDTAARFNGLPCVDITVYKSGQQDAIDISRKVQAYVAGKHREPFPEKLDEFWSRITGKTAALRKIYDDAYNNPFPEGMQLEVHSNLANYIEGRLELLTKNSLQGLFLVGVTLLIFLDWRVALWAMVGVVFSIAGTAILMKVMGASLNLISMFGLLIVTGILVDDAIIVSENIFARVEAGQDPHEAAIRGTEEVQGPVVICVLTTIAAFAPMIFIEGQIGDFFKVLPIVAIFALGTSLIEALTMLPTHLSESLHGYHKEVHAGTKKPHPFFALVSRITTPIAALIPKVVAPVYQRVLQFAVQNRYVGLAAMLALMMITVGLVMRFDRAGNPTMSGRVPFVFVQKMDSETMLCDVELPVGTPVETTSDIVRSIEQTMLSREKYPEIKNVFSLIGLKISADEGGVDASVRSHVAQVILELHSVENRDRPSDAIVAQLREEIGLPAGVNSLRFQSLQGGPAGAEIEIEIVGDDQQQLLALADRLKDELTKFDGVFDVDDDFDDGRREFQVALLDSARPLGITTEWLASEIRAAYFGLEARTLQRDREDVDIRVRFPAQRRRDLADFALMRITLPDGRAVPLSELARVEETRGFTSLRRVNQRRCVTVTADVEQSITTSDQVLAEMAALREQLLAENPGVAIEYAGKKLESRKSLGSLNRDFWIALGIIYVLLAGLFKSYLQPLVVMSSVPFALIGAVWGHYLMGYPLTILSMIGMIALTGVAVNDGVVMLEFINHEIRDGKPLRQAVLTAGTRRLRAILLTSTTTVIGTAPMVLEQSFQARFLIPMVISLSAGLMFCTVLTLLAIPAFYVILDDLKRVTASLFGRRSAPAAQPVPA